MDKNESADHIVSAKDVFKAAQLINPLIRITPLETSEALTRMTGTEVRLKLENQQNTGSFKLRGAANVIANLSQNEREIGVIAPTAGNHGLALAHAGKAARVPVTICLPETADPMKLAAMEASNAKVEFFHAPAYRFLSGRSDEPRSRSSVLPGKRPNGWLRMASWIAGSNNSQEETVS
ncbi:pyridoxal-phosphate dependent enzyme [Novosphingobium sp. KA1]|uniref:pyridoxal-phosphate dependent enzyme n=1 Tax=Novosphingobium sp. (strain KA1) TaxID=164608 RepID=UPI001A8EF849|nr:pyridoxal-phosphate dependent enzyme [Novosphingobium sp. KA1]QSR19563.1 hypothetical protein CA833_20605 [Novosphingobium sp. KA1]